MGPDEVGFRRRRSWAGGLNLRAGRLPASGACETGLLECHDPKLAAALDPLDASAGAEAILTIDLDAIAANWRLLSERAAPSARCAAVIKADAYGLGAARVGPALARAGCGRFVVATLDEALSLRRALTSAEILVLSGPLPGAEREFAAAQVVPVLNSPEQVAAWAAMAKRHGKPTAAVLHVDTGMSRLGLSHRQALALAADADTLAAIDLKLVMSHLACADQPEHPMNRSQLLAFTAARALFPGVEGSLAASSGIFLGKDWHADWVRPGAALYGIRPFTEGPNPMVDVISLAGRILQVREIEAQASVSYGATYRASERRRLATVAVGYADGWFRTLSNRGWGLLDGRRVPLVGRVTMDLSIFDVTQVREGAARAGSFIELIGGGNPLDEVARAAGTIGYEVLTSLGKRFRRRYLEKCGGGGALQLDGEGDVPRTTAA